MIANTAAWRAADIGAANGHTNARALAKILSAISLGGTVDGVQLLKPRDRGTHLRDRRCEGPDLVLAGHHLRMGSRVRPTLSAPFGYIPDEQDLLLGRLGRIVGDR